MNLTIRESQVLEMMFQCRSGKEIADALSISHSCVKIHSNNIYRKAGIGGEKSGKLLRLLRLIGQLEFSARWIQK